MQLTLPLTRLVFCNGTGMITATELRVLLEDPKNISDIVSEQILSDETPFVFLDNPAASVELAQKLKKSLGISESNVRIIGSARVGFALSPDAFPRPFTDESDVDVLVVDEALFDLVWQSILAWNYPRRYKLPKQERRWQQKMQSDLFWGWFVPDRIRYEGLQFPKALLPMRDLSTKWFDAFQELGSQPALLRREVNGRLYRSWKHAQLYHIDSLRRVRATLKEGVL